MCSLAFYPTQIDAPQFINNTNGQINLWLATPCRFIHITYINLKQC